MRRVNDITVEESASILKSMSRKTTGTKLLLQKVSQLQLKSVCIYVHADIGAFLFSGKYMKLTLRKR